MVEGVVAFQFGPRNKRELLGYLLLGLVSLASGLFLAISDALVRRAEDEVAVSIGERQCAVGEFFGLDVAGVRRRMSQYFG
jgi:hypothetical protein